jgi:periplasmic protein CpxP/Spy
VRLIGAQTNIMNTSKLSLAAALALGGLVAWSSAAIAQDNKPNERSRPGVRAGGENRSERGNRPEGAGRPEMRDRLQQMGEELKLTAEQKEKLKPIFEAEREKMAKLRDDTSLTEEQRRGKYREIADATSAKVKPILTAEQQAKWQKLREERRGRPQQRNN